MKDMGWDDPKQEQDWTYSAHKRNKLIELIAAIKLANKEKVVRLPVWLQTQFQRRMNQKENYINLVDNYSSALRRVSASLPFHPIRQTLLTRVAFDRFTPQS